MCTFQIKTRVLYHQIREQNQEQTPSNELGAVFFLVFYQVN